MAPATQAQPIECAAQTQGVFIEHTFDSGASWSGCALLNDRHGLELQNLAYRAPGDSQRLVLQSLHLGQLFLHYHQDNQANLLINPSQGLGGVNALPLNSTTCSGELLGSGDYFCTEVMATGILAKYSNQASIQGEQWRIFSVSLRDSLTWQTSITLAEDGRITPGISLSGRATQTTDDPRYGVALDGSNRYTSAATLLANWRMAFAINGTADDDTVEEFDFPLNAAAGNQRTMQVFALSTESLRVVEPERFRGWRVRDQSGSGYYLDPQNSGFRFVSRQFNWPQFDLAVTRLHPCERHAQFNDTLNGSCSDNLDAFINGESLLQQSPVLWFNLARTYRPRREDIPAIASVQLTFDLLPFDWTTASPFEAPFGSADE